MPSDTVGDRVWVLVEKLADSHQSRSMEELKELDPSVEYPKTEKVWCEGLAILETDSDATINIGGEAVTVKKGVIQQSRPVRSPHRCEPLADDEREQLAQRYPEKWGGGDAE